jgi:hypothetical protein
MTAICPGCEKPMVYDGITVFNGLLKCHWDCTDATKSKMGETNANDLVLLRVKARLAQDGLFPGHPVYDKMISEVLNG